MIKDTSILLQIFAKLQFYDVYTKIFGTEQDNFFAINYTGQFLLQSLLIFCKVTEI